MVQINAARKGRGGVRESRKAAEKEVVIVSKAARQEGETNY